MPFALIGLTIEDEEFWAKSDSIFGLIYLKSNQHLTLVCCVFLHRGHLICQTPNNYAPAKEFFVFEAPSACVRYLLVPISLKWCKISFWVLQCCPQVKVLPFSVS